MFFSVIVILLFTITIIVLGYKKHLTWSICLYFIGIALLITASILYTLKFSTTILENHTDRVIYHMVFSTFSFINTNITEISNILNLGIVFIMLGSALFMKIIKPSAKKTFWVYIAACLAFFILNHHTVCYKSFIFINSIDNPELIKLTQTVYESARILSYLLFIFMLLLPHPFLIQTFIKSNIYIRRKDSITTEMCLILVNVFIIYYFVSGRFSVFMPWNVTLLKFPADSVVVQSKTFIMQVLLLLSLTILYITIRYNPFSSMKFQTKKAMLNEYFELNHSLKMIFHTNKNILQTIDLLAGQAIDFYEKKKEISLGNLREIQTMVHDSQLTLSRMLGMLDDISIKNVDTNLADALDKAIAQIVLPPNITVTKNYEYSDRFIIKANPHHIVESLVNILRNSVEAIETKDITDGNISVSLYYENEYIAVEITDNGCGIKKSDLKNIFNILTSTKKSSTNWGIGLNYVRKVVDIYNGNLYVKSECGKYTTIQIDFRCLKAK